MEQKLDPIAEITTEKAIDDRTGRDLEQLFRQITTDNVPSGILHRTIFPHLEIEAYDGGPDSPALDQTTFEQFYFELQQGALEGFELVSLLDEKAGWIDRAPGNAIPVAILDYDYDGLTPAFLASLQRSISEKTGIDIPANPDRVRQARELFAASPLLPRQYEDFSLLDFVHDGAAFDLYLDPELYFTNRKRKPEFCIVNLNDGRGERRFDWGATISTLYDTAEDREIRLTAHFDDGTEKTCRFLIRMREERPAPTPDETWKLTAKVDDGKRTIYGTAWVWYGAGNKKLTKPMVMAEGFPGGYTLNYLYGRFNQQNMLDEIRKQQYDFIIVSFKHENTNYGNGSLADSAMLVVDCIRQAIGKRTGDEKLVVGGASMGGLVSRYALTYMEQEVIDHQCKQFITFDSPHRGAYIPVANQWFLRMFEDQSSTAKEGVAMLNTMAARQMLLYYVRDWKPGSGNLVHEEHIRFFASLRALGNYPEEPRKLALTDGRGDGKLQESEGAALRWSYKFETVAVWANLINLPHMKSDWETCARAYHVGIDFWHSYYLNVRNTIGYDGSPGGLGDTTKRIANGFEAICSVGSTLYFGFPCFIPSISALGIDRNDPWVDISSLPRDVSAFDDFVYNDKNITHTDVTVAMRDWLLKYLSTTETVDA